MDGQRRCGTRVQWNTTQSYKEDAVMPFAATWMQLEFIIL